MRIPLRLLFILPFCILFILAKNNPLPPAATRIPVTPGMVFQTTSAQKKPQLLFDGDTTTVWVSDFFNGWAIDATNGQYCWVVLDSFYNYPWSEVFNGPFSGGDTVSYQCFYDWTDTTRHSQVFNTTLQTSTWKPIDSANSRLYSDSFRLIRIRIKTGASNDFREWRFYGHALAPAASIYPSPGSDPPDEGIAFRGYGKVFGDTLMDDAGKSQEIQQNTDYFIPSLDGSGKTLSINKFGDMTVNYFSINQRQDRIGFPYLAGPRPKFKYADSTNSTKDMPIGADSTSLTAWAFVDTAVYGLVAKLGHNSSASLAGFSYTNAPAGAGLGYINEIHIGHEDDAHFDPKGAIRLHMPLVKIRKMQAANNGAKRADPTMKVMDGALTGNDTDYYKGEYIENLIANKTKTLPFDIWGYDYYSTNTGTQGSPGSHGISPEQDQAWIKWASCSAIQQRLAPGMPRYIFEYGFDVHDGSNYVVPDISGQNRELTKAYWEMRGYEIASTCSIGRFYMYTQRSTGGGDFSTTGFSYDTFLVSPGNTLPSYLWQFMDAGHLAGGGFVSLPRELYWHMTMAMGVLQNYKSTGTVIRNGDSTGIWIVKHDHLTRSDSAVFAVWYGTHNNTSSSNYSLGANIISAKITVANNQVKTGTTTTATVSNGVATIPTVNEGVTYVSAKVSVFRGFPIQGRQFIFAHH